MNPKRNIFDEIEDEKHIVRDAGRKLAEAIDSYGGMTPDLRRILDVLFAARDEHRRAGDYNGMILCIRVIERVLKGENRETT